LATSLFSPPRVDAKRENVLGKDEILASISLPPPKPNSRSTYHKILDREAWTHAVATAIVLEMDGETSKGARIVLGGVAPTLRRLEKVGAMLAGQRITPELAARAGETAVEGANPLTKNAWFAVCWCRSLKEREAAVLKPRRHSSRVSAAERSLEATSVRFAATLPALRRCSSEPTNQVRQTLPR
jgi:CO/xanthine dehydrogenase FAD-binding subunit